MTLFDENSVGGKRFFGMGFKLKSKLTMPYNNSSFSSPDNFVMVRIVFVCICGREEQFQGIYLREAINRGFVNIFDELMRNGALSRNHLLADGYTEKEVDAMERRLEEFA